MQASKRKHNEVAEKLETYEELFSMIETYDERGVAEIVRWVRSGQSPQSIVQHMRTDSDLAGPDMQTLALHTFLINLAHSTGSLRQIVRLAVAVSTPNNSAQVPSPRVFKALHDRIVLFSYMEDMLHASPQTHRSPPLLLDGAGSSHGHHPQYRIASQIEIPEKDNSMPNSPPCRVPARPWTTLTADDDAVSHLVSLFLVWINPTWRFVEADLFLSGKRLLNLCRSLEVVEDDTLTSRDYCRHDIEGSRLRILFAFLSQQHSSYC